MLKYQTAIYNLCLRMTANPEDAADLTQDVFLKLWRYLDSFHFDSAFSTWLYRMATNTCLDFLRAAKRRPKTSLTVEDADGEAQVLDVPDPAPSPEETVLATIEREQAQAAMEQLEPEQRQILTLRVVNELSYAEIGAILQVPEGTVKSRLARARENLRKKLLQTGNKTESETSITQKQKGGCENDL